MIQPKTNCPNCGREITKATLNKHYLACINPNSKLNTVGKFKPLPLRDAGDQTCHFCGKLCKNLNSVKQHECRCKENPGRKAFANLSNYVNSESKDERSSRCNKSGSTLKQKYDAGFISPIKGRKIVFEYIYAQHNDLEISNWLNYVSNKIIDIPEYEIINHPEGYKVISKAYFKENNSIKLYFEHMLIANLLIDNQLSKGNTVHHIDRNRSNNDKMNLMIFATSDDHKRYHNSPYAYLIYNEEIHLFTCELHK